MAWVFEPDGTDRFTLIKDTEDNIRTVEGSVVGRLVQEDAGGGSGNATVPNDAPIQPPQAFVDSWERIRGVFVGWPSAGDPGDLSDTVDLSNLGIVTIPGQDFILFMASSYVNLGYDVTIDLSDNLIGTAELDRLVAEFGDSAGVVANIQGDSHSTVTLDLRGAGMGTPSENPDSNRALVIAENAGTADANDEYDEAALVNGRKSWIGSVAGVYTIEWTGAIWRFRVTAGSDVAYESTDDVGYPWRVTTWTVGAQGTLPLPELSNPLSQIKNPDIATMESDGWVVLHN